MMLITGELSCGLITPDSLHLPTHLVFINAMGIKRCVLKGTHTLNGRRRVLVEESRTECQDIYLVQPIISYVMWGVPLLSALSFFNSKMEIRTLGLSASWGCVKSKRDSWCDLALKNCKVLCTWTCTIADLQPFLFTVAFLVLGPWQALKYLLNWTHLRVILLYAISSAKMICFWSSVI